MVICKLCFLFTRYFFWFGPPNLFFKKHTRYYILYICFIRNEYKIYRPSKEGKERSGRDGVSYHLTNSYNTQ